MEIIETSGKKFVVLERINLERFDDDESRNNYFRGKVWLRQANSNIAITVSEVIDANFEDVPLDDKKEIANESV